MPKGLSGSGITLCRSFLHRQNHSVWLVRSVGHCRGPAVWAHAALLLRCSLSQGSAWPVIWWLPWLCRWAALQQHQTMLNTVLLQTAELNSIELCPAQTPGGSTQQLPAHFSAACLFTGT